MKHAEVHLGHEYLSRVSGELVRVKVLTQTVRHNFRSDRQVFVCRNLKTGKTIQRSAAGLRPVSEPRAPHPCAESIGLLLANERADRRDGLFDRALAARELARALAAERNGGPMTRIARQTLLREFGVSG